MDTNQIEQERDKIIAQFGEWTAGTIWLRDNLFTTDPQHPEHEGRIIGHGIHLRRILQVVSDITNQPFEKLRVLDLACLEGLYGIEFARQGAEVVGIEGREANIAKARFVKDVLKLDNLTLFQDDVRNLSVEAYGYFDVVLCLGILYHLDAPDVFDFTRKLGEVCRRVAIIDTHLSDRAATAHHYDGAEYHGSVREEHAHRTAPEEKLKFKWASLDNEQSFWFTLPSLLNLLSRSGFTSIYTCHNPAVPGWAEYGKHTIVAIKGQPQELISTPLLNSLPAKQWTENSVFGVIPTPDSDNSSPSLRQRLVRKIRSTTARLLK